MVSVSGDTDHALKIAQVPPSESGGICTWALLLCECGSSAVSYAPCCNCRQTRNGRLQYFYLAAFDGDRKLNYRLRLCQECTVALVSDLVNVADRQDEGGVWRSAEWWG